MLKSLVSDGIQGSSDSPIENAIEKQFGTKVPATLIHLWTLASSAEKKAVDSWEKISRKFQEIFLCTYFPTVTISNDKHSMMVFGLLGWFPIKFLGKKTEDQMDVDEEDEVKEWICLDLENNYVVKISLKNGTPTYVQKPFPFFHPFFSFPTFPSLTFIKHHNLSSFAPCLTFG